MRTRYALILAASFVLAACATVPPSPSQSPPVLPTVAPSQTAAPTPTADPTATPMTQRHECGNLSADFCEEVIAAVIRRVPEMVESPIAVTATLDQDRPSQWGGDWEVLVGFAPIGGETDMWSPGIWLARQRMTSSDWQVEVWRDGPLPDHFIELMRTAGLKV